MVSRAPPPYTVIHPGKSQTHLPEEEWRVAHKEKDRQIQELMAVVTDLTMALQKTTFNYMPKVTEGAATGPSSPIRKQGWYAMAKGQSPDSMGIYNLYSQALGHINKVSGACWQKIGSPTKGNALFMLARKTKQ